MIQFTKPENLNGGKLITELAAAGVVVDTETSPLIDGNGNFWLDIASAKEQIAKTVVAAHNGGN